jgi:hypothetical protein
VEVSVNGIVHDKTIQILAPRYDLDASISELYIVHNDISLISVETHDPDCGGVILPDDVKFNATITNGGNFGILQDPVTGQSGSELSGISHSQGSFIFNFVADGDVPGGTNIIQIEISASDPSVRPVTVNLPIKPASLAVSFNTDFLGMGDTAIVHVMHLLPDGTTEEIPDQRFDVDMIQGGTSATLIDPMSGQTGASLFAVPNDFYVTSADSISTDSLLVKFHIGTFCDVCMAGAIKFHSNDTAKSVWKGNEKSLEILRDSVKLKYPAAKASKKPSGKPDIVESVKGNPPSSGRYKKVNEYYGDFTAVAKIWEKKPTLEITKPTKYSPPELISSEPKMPTVTCEAKLNNYKKGAVTYEWEYWVSYKLKRRDIDNHKFVPLATRDAEIRFNGTSFANNSDITQWLVSFDTDHSNYIKFKAQQPQRNPKYHKYYGGDTNKVITNWTDGFNIFIGGYVFLQVTARNADGYIIGFKQDTVNKILGNNPQDVNTIYNYAGNNEIIAILIHEAKTKQFAIDNTNWPQYE